jgi:hypothetical protein
MELEPSPLDGLESVELDPRGPSDLPLKCRNQTLALDTCSHQWGIAQAESFEFQRSISHRAISAAHWASDNIRQSFN